MPGTKDKDFTKRLLARAHSPRSASRIFNDKIRQKSQSLAPTDGGSRIKDRQDARARRLRRREALTFQKRRKPRVLSAREKRQQNVLRIPEAERRYCLYEGLHKMWCAYMRELFHAPLWKTGQADSGEEPGSEPSEEQRKRYLDALKRFHVEPATAGPRMAGADLHGAKVTVVRSRCVSRVSLQGIVVKDTKFTVELITTNNEVKRVPKEHTVFRVEMPLYDAEDLDDDLRQRLSNVQSLVFELHGEQFKNRAPDRASKKIKMHIPTDL